MIQGSSSERHKGRRKTTDIKMMNNQQTTRKIFDSLLIILIITFSSSFISISKSQQFLLDLPPPSSSSLNHNNASRISTSVTILQQQQQQQIISTFSTPNQATNITHVTYDPLYDTIYIGATNAIYQLKGNDLSQQYQHTTGPIYDNPSCGINECPGYEDYMKPTTNVNKVLVIDYQNKKLLSCGSVKQGACRRYELNNIQQKDQDLIPIAVAANDDNSSTYAFIAPARYNYDTTSSSSSSSSSNGFIQQQVLYVGTTYTKFGQSRDLLVPAIGTRTLKTGPDFLKLYENLLDSARVDINSHLRDYFLVNYLYGFASSNYIYFVTVQKKATTRDYEELGYHTRLARICITDSTYNSYTEVDLKCMPNRNNSLKRTAPKSSFFGAATNTNQAAAETLPNEYPLLQDAILVDAGSKLLESLGQLSSPLTSSDDSKVLLGVFSSAKDHTQHAGEHSALCAFSLAQIEEKFNDNIHSCYTGKMQSRNMEYIAGNVQECPKNGQGGTHVNFCHETLKINGTLPIVSEASLQLYNTTLTAITATSHVNTYQKNIYSDQLSSELQSYESSSSSSSSASKFTSSSSSSASKSNSANMNTVVFMGTSNGHLKKVLLNNASNGIEFDDIQLDSSNNPILGDIHLDASGEHVIAATPYKVMKVAIQNCGQYSTCRECSQSKNPYCGWCPLKRSCTSENECLISSSSIDTREPILVGRQQQQQQSGIGQIPQAQESMLSASAKSQLKWISSEAAKKCIDLQSIVPDKIPFTNTGKVDLYIDRLQRSNIGTGPTKQQQNSYKCIFDKKEQTVATLTPFGLTCPLPQVSNRPKIQPGKDHVVVELSVRSSETNTDFLNGRITFFDCQALQTCMNCLTANWGCNWCMNENSCHFNASKCDKIVPIATTNATTQTPLITISNADNQRSALSLTTLSSSGGLAGSISSLVRSNQHRTSNTINLVNQCPGYDSNIKHHQEIANAGQADGVSESNNNGKKNTQQQQFTKVPIIQTTTTRQTPFAGEPFSSQSFDQLSKRPGSIPSMPLNNNYPNMDPSIASRVRQTAGTIQPQQPHDHNSHSNYNRFGLNQHHHQYTTGWPYQQPPPPSSPYQSPPQSYPTIPDFSPTENHLTDIQIRQQQQQQLSSGQQQQSFMVPFLTILSVLISIALLVVVLMAAAGSSSSSSVFLLNKIDALKSFSLMRRARGGHASALARAHRHHQVHHGEKPLPNVGHNVMINSLRAGLKSSAASSVSGLSAIFGNSQLTDKQTYCSYNNGAGNYATSGSQYYQTNHPLSTSQPPNHLHQPPTADLLGNGYQQQHQQHQHQQPQYPIYHIDIATANPAQTTRLIWQNGNGTSPDGFTMDGSYMPLSSNAPSSDDTGNVYQTIY